MPDVEDAEDGGQQGVVEHEVDNVIDEGTFLINLVLQEQVVDEEVNEGSVAVHANRQVLSDTFEVIGVTLPPLHLHITMDVPSEQNVDCDNDGGHEKVEGCAQSFDA